MWNLLGDQKVICYEENGTLQRIKWQYIEALNCVQEDLQFSLANRLKKQFLLWTDHKMNVRIDAQTLSSSVASAIDFLQEQTDLPDIKGSEATTLFMKQVDRIFDMLNGSNSFAKGYKAPVNKEILSLWLKQCDKVLSYLLSLKGQRQKLLIEGHCKTIILGFTFSIHSLVSIAQEYLSCECCPLQYILTYKFSQEHTELLFNKIPCRCGWNNNPNVLPFMYALRRLLISNSIEPSNTGNFTHFHDALYEPNGLFDFPFKAESTPRNHNWLQWQWRELQIIQLDQESPNELQDYVFYFILGFVVRALISKLKCKECIG